MRKIVEGAKTIGVMAGTIIAVATIVGYTGGLIIGFINAPVMREISSLQSQQSQINQKILDQLETLDSRLSKLEKVYE